MYFAYWVIKTQLSRQTVFSDVTEGTDKVTDNTPSCPCLLCKPGSTCKTSLEGKLEAKLQTEG